ncbi:MAG TPA: hypothetical protein VF334_24395 [Polyangia bacterium]
MMLALVLVAGGSAGAGWALRAATGRRRPLDVIGALVAPACIVAALTGGVMLLVPSLLR